MKLEIGKIVVDKGSTKDALEVALSLLAPVNAGLQKAVETQNVGIAGQQQANLALAYGVLKALNEKISSTLSDVKV